MLILALESAGIGCSACVWRDGAVLAAAFEVIERGQDQCLLPLILEVMKKANVAFAALDRIACTRGPGSFTGIRIGLAAARGLGLAAGKPVIGIDRFAIFHEQIKAANKNLLVIINSRRKELYCRFYSVSGSAAEATMMTADEIVNFLDKNKNTEIAGDFDPSIFQSLHNAEDGHAFLKQKDLEIGRGPGDDDVQKNLEVITCAKLAACVEKSDAIYLPRPLYIRQPDVTMRKKLLGIRAVSIDDAPILSKLHIESFGTAGWNVAQIQGSLVLATTHGWIAQAGDEPIGFILCQIMPGQSEVLTFCVQPSHRRKGIGEKLLRQAIVAIKTERDAAIMLEAAADNLAARKLYEKLGFVATGCRANYYLRGNAAVDAVLYTWDNSAAVSRTSAGASSTI